MGEQLLRARDLAKSYASGGGRLDVLSHCDLTVEVGERVAIVGQSGVGKSTLLHLLAGLDRPDRGQIEFRGRGLDRMSDLELAEFRNRQVGMVFQFYHLLPEFTATENVAMPLLIGGRPDGAQERARTLLEEVGLAERGHHFPSELSGGERQRVAIARALASGPDLLLADEPTGNLDHDNGLRIMQVFQRVYDLHGVATVMVTHNPELVSSFVRVLAMRPGGALVPMESTEGSAD